MGYHILVRQHLQIEAGPRIEFRTKTPGHELVIIRRSDLIMIIN